MPDPQYKRRAYRVTPAYVAFQWNLVKPRAWKLYSAGKVLFKDCGPEEHSISASIIFYRKYGASVGGCVRLRGQNDDHLDASMTISARTSFASTHWQDVSDDRLTFELPGDIWTASPHMIVFLYVRRVEPLQVVEHPVLSKLLSSDLNLMADVEVHCSDGIVQAHGVFLASVSPYFVERLCGKAAHECSMTEEGRLIIDMQEFTAQDFRGILEYACTSKVAEPKQVTFSMLKLADKLMLDELKAIYEHSLCMSSRESEFYNDVVFANDNGLEIFKEVSTRRIHTCWDAIFAKVVNGAAKDLELFFEIVKGMASPFAYLNMLNNQ